MNQPAIEMELERPRVRTGLVVNTGVANIYGEDTFQSEVVTQAILGEMPEVLDQRGKWFSIRQWDDYQGWLYHFYMSKNPEFGTHREWIRVNALTAHIREEPAEAAVPIRDVVFGSELPMISQDGAWLEVLLPDGLSGWLRDDPQETERPPREQLVHIARRFLGAPYMWGGKTPKGFDCSGFIQTCFKANGVVLPRDARLQHTFRDLPPVDLADAQPGDLFFFSEKEQRIPHVARSVGGGDFIHSSGWGRIESLEKESPRYNHLLRGIFITAKDVMELLDGG
ncbi:MAG: C40 family peptidase [Fidelibacterota bacterium]|nr:MAG: C40 family peptidase [Candidatus Neomarinimicrobiota bacterium]